jgi:hypothetical protein
MNENDLDELAIILEKYLKERAKSDKTNDNK